MGGDPIPGPLDPLVKWFEEWKATLPKVKTAPRRPHVKGPVHVTGYLLGSPSRRRRT